MQDFHATRPTNPQAAPVPPSAQPGGFAGGGYQGSLLRANPSYLMVIQ
jgi:hypothetical protein